MLRQTPRIPMAIINTTRPPIPMRRLMERFIQCTLPVCAANSQAYARRALFSATALKMSSLKTS